MSQVRRTLWEWLRGRTIDYSVGTSVDNMPVVETPDGQRIQPLMVRLVLIGDRFARIALTGPVLDDPHQASTGVYYDSWEEMPEDVAEALQANFDGS